MRGRQEKDSSRPRLILRRISILWASTSRRGRASSFETVLQVVQSKSALALPAEEDDLDGLNYLAGRQMDVINAQALQGTVLAHQDGGVPVMVLKIPELSAYYFGYLVYFFEKACAMSGYLLGVNPFNQPGVEEYKQNLFALLGRAGYEERRQRILARLAKGE